jgi:hypothetical protein
MRIWQFGRCQSECRIPIWRIAPAARAGVFTGTNARGARGAADAWKPLRHQRMTWQIVRGDIITQIAAVPPRKRIDLYAGHPAERPINLEQV